ncbi:MAG TPA: putative toxin-antitoxin system toxin component, PIN family, partial [Lysobacter sp.]|nr:putative toxin-antitoxin system toxin component, PIN family [Lysobacter sp.]
MNESAPRVVLDTNVCLDLFLFDDPRVARLRDALQAGAVVAAIDDVCREEWLRVLDYPQLGLDDAQRATAIARFDASMMPASVAAATKRDRPSLPRCKDPDDQKFLELALHADACWLLSRDDHLLALAARTRRAGLFEILTPQAWAAAFT